MQPNLEALSRDQRRVPEGHFLLLPSDSGSLLLKSIAMNELLLPSDLQPRLEGTCGETRQVLASCLDQVLSKLLLKEIVAYSEQYKFVN